MLFPIASMSRSRLLSCVCYMAFLCCSGVTYGMDMPSCIVKCRAKSLPNIFESSSSFIKAVCVFLPANGTTEGCAFDILSIASAVPLHARLARQFSLQGQMKCKKRMRIHLSNIDRLRWRNAIGYFDNQNCDLGLQDVAVFGKFVDLYVLLANTLVDDSALLLRNASIGPIGGAQNVGTGLNLIGSLRMTNAKDEFYRELFSKKFIWYRMAEVRFWNMTFTDVDAEGLETTMPLLNSLELNYNKLTKPPNFPWTNNPRRLPINLTRTPTFNSHYSARINFHIKPNIYRSMFVLDYNYIQDLSTHEFHGHLDKLSLEGNGLRVVGPNCFRALKAVQFINLAHNRLKYLPDEVFYGLNQIDEINLAHNNITAIGSRTFNGVENIKILNLANNNISHLEPSAFRNLRSLEVLHLQNNNISILSRSFPEDSRTLREVYLQNNRLTRIPSWAFLLNTLQTLDLSNNRLNFTSLVDLCDTLSQNTEQPDNWGTTGPRNNRGRSGVMPKINLAGNLLTTMDVRRLNGSKTEIFKRMLRNFVLDLTGNGLKCDCNILPLKKYLDTEMKQYGMMDRFETWICSEPPNLRGRAIASVTLTDLVCQRTLLDCPKQCKCLERGTDGTLIVDCRNRKLLQMPNRIPQEAKELLLDNNQLSEVAPRQYLSHLKKLTLVNNQLARVMDSFIYQLELIQVLDLSFNRLPELPKVIQKLQFNTLNVLNNFLRCDCNSLWLKDWIIQHRESIVDSDQILCNSGKGQGEPIMFVKDGYFVCPPPEVPDWAVALGILSAISTLFSIIIGFSWWYRYEIKVIVYCKFDFHPFDNEKDDNDPDKVFDAFISYSGLDYHWPCLSLTPRLEARDPPYRLCLHDRDFAVGAPISDNINSAIQRSKRMIVILTNNYLDSDWCLLEFKMAHQKVLKERNKYLIVIVHEDVKMDALPEELKLYVKTNTYLEVSNKWFWEKLFYAMPRKSRKTASDSDNVDKSPSIPLTNMQCSELMYNERNSGYFGSSTRASTHISVNIPEENSDV